MSRKNNPETTGLWGDQYGIWIAVFIILIFANIVILYHFSSFFSTLLSFLIFPAEILIVFLLIGKINHCPKCFRLFVRKLYRRKQTGSRKEKQRVKTSSGSTTTITQNVPIFTYMYKCKKCSHQWSKRK